MIIKIIPHYSICLVNCYCDVYLAMVKTNTNSMVNDYFAVKSQKAVYAYL